MNPIELASSVQRMLAANELEPSPEFAYVVHDELEDSSNVRVVVIPSNPESERTSRRGDFIDTITVDVGVIQKVQPDSTEQIEQNIALEQSIIQLLKENKPIDSESTEIAAAVFRIAAEPIYSQEKLNQGVFVGVIRAEYTL